MKQNKTKISMIAAIGQHRELGKDNKLLWSIPEDMKRFKELTTGHTVIMGRKTYESIGRALPNRVNVVITRDKSFKPPNCIVFHSFEEVIKAIKDKKIDGNEIFIIGGGQIYKEGIKYADRLYLTIVEGNFEADTYFPDYSNFKKEITKKSSSFKTYKYTFNVLEKSF